MYSSVLLACLLLTGGRTAQAGAGVAGADILKIPVDARGWGMGTAYSAIADDVGAIAYNPAGLGLGRSRELRFTYLSLIETNIYSVMGSYPIGQWGTFGALFAYRNLPTIENEGTAARPLIGLTKVDMYDSVLGGYVAFKLSRLFPKSRVVAPMSFGAGIKKVKMNIAGLGTGVTAADLGLLYSLAHARFSLGLQNLGGGYKFPGSDDSDSLPSTLRTAAAFAPIEDENNLLTMAVENASYIGVSSRQKNGAETTTSRESLNVLGLGVEYWRIKMMGVRLGYVQPWGKSAKSYSSGRGIAIGTSFRVRTERMGYQIDIAYRPLSLGSARQDALTVSLSLRF